MTKLGAAAALGLIAVGLLFYALGLFPWSVLFIAAGFFLGGIERHLGRGERDQRTLAK